MTVRRILPGLIVSSLLSLSIHASRQILVGNQSFSNGRIYAHLAEKDLDLNLAAGWKPEQMQRAARLLKQFYRDRGFPLAEVRLQIREKDFLFEITEGPKARLGWIEFTGNQALSSEQLRKLSKFSDYLDFDHLEKSLEEIRSAYRNAGYVRATVQTPKIDVLEIKSGQNRIRLTIPIEEGAPYSYGKISLPSALRNLQLSPSGAGAAYSESELLSFRDRVVQHFKEQGRLLKDFRIYQRIDDILEQVHLDVQYELLPPLTIRRIEFAGNSRYPDSFYRRELKLVEGDCLDPQQLERSLRELKGTGVLASVSRDDVELIIDYVNLEANVIIYLHEKKPRKVLYSFGTDGFGGLEANLFYSIANLLGLGEELGLELSAGSHTSSIAIGLASRYLLGTQIPVSLALQFFRRHTEFKLPGLDDSVRKLFGADQIGFSVGGSYRIRPAQELGAMAMVEQFSGTTQSKHFVLEPFWAHSSSRGNHPTQKIRIAQRFSLFQGDSDSWNLRSDIDYRRFFGETSPAPHFAIRVHASHAHFLSGLPPDPALLRERIFPDGNELRGFSRRSTTPWAKVGKEAVPIGGDTLVTLSSEYRIPLNQSVSLAPFADAGLNMSLADPQPYRLLEDTNRIWRASVGSEARVQLPGRLPNVRLIFSWNPLRLDRELKDPATAFRIALEPPF